MTLDEFEGLLQSALPRVRHYEAFKEQEPYVVWTEYRQINRHADNKPQGGFWRVQVDCYVKPGDKASANALEAMLAANEIPYIRKSFFDANTKIVRHLFDCEVMFTGQI